MNRFAFISRHQPTAEQFALAEQNGIVLIPVGDMDAFTVNAADIGDFEGVVVVHPAAAMRLSSKYIIAVFENGTRPEEGGKPSFFAKDLHIYDMRPCETG
jgi:hypothetical protein